MNKTYRVFLEPEAHRQGKVLPGNVRQRIKRMISGLVAEPRPHFSQQLDTSGIDVPGNIELRRIRIDQWRIIYAVNIEENWIWIWGIRKRPPYDYDDLPDFSSRLT